LETASLKEMIFIFDGEQQNSISSMTETIFDDINEGVNKTTFFDQKQTDPTVKPTTNNKEDQLKSLPPDKNDFSCFNDYIASNNQKYSQETIL